MYGSDAYLHPNSLHRYAIGDRTKGLRRAADGSLTITLSNSRPRGALPAPTGYPPPPAASAF